MRILIASQSKNQLNAVTVKNVKNFPIRISSDCVEELEHLGESQIKKMKTYSDNVFVDVCSCSKDDELKIIGAYELPIERIAKIQNIAINDILYQYEIDIRNEYAHEISNKVFDKINFENLLKEFYSKVDTNKKKAKTILNKIKKLNTIPFEVVRAESYFEIL